MSDAPRSAYEIAMERLRARDRDRGEEPTRALSSKQKEEIAETRRIYDARIAEREILHDSESERARQDPEKAREVEEAYRADRRRLEAERDAKIAKIREGR